MGTRNLSRFRYIQPNRRRFGMPSCCCLIFQWLEEPNIIDWFDYVLVSYFEVCNINGHDLRGRFRSCTTSLRHWKSETCFSSRMHRHNCVHTCVRTLTLEACPCWEQETETGLDELRAKLKETQVGRSLAYPTRSPAQPNTAYPSPA